jgi:Thaumatin family
MLVINVRGRPGRRHTRTASPAGTTAASGSPAAAPPARAPARAAAAAGVHLVTFVNRVSQTIWVGAAQNPAHPLARTGWKLMPGHSLTITVPKHWNGRFWAGPAACSVPAVATASPATAAAATSAPATGSSRPPWPSTT